MTLGILCLGRSTFDIRFADEKLAGMLAALDRTDRAIAGQRHILLDDESTEGAIRALKKRSLTGLLLLQATFTDAATAARAASEFDCPIMIWAIPEPRIGGRLRLNSFCGLNLASHALSLREREFGWIYCDPQSEIAERELAELLAGNRLSRRIYPHPVPEASPLPCPPAESLKTKRIARLGEPPPGFDTCHYDARQLKDVFGISVDELGICDLFEAAKNSTREDTESLLDGARESLQGIDELDASSTSRSMELCAGLESIRAEGAFDAIAIRCWPETFTEFGGAVCGPVGTLCESKIPCACEADVYGSVSQLMLQEIASQPVFLADLADLDSASDTGVVWHCGQAPYSMKDPEAPATATVHSNRRLPLLREFPLRPGRITFLRVSRSFGELKIVMAGGEMLKRPMAFTGTSGIFRFDLPASEALRRIIGCGLEHHMALAYGDFRNEIRSVAAHFGLPCLEL
ncbi:MAG: hypothetical protein OXI01_03715 [Albidovulum sp.]|nr:hypothetical protein [Albidovulum sp.]